MKKQGNSNKISGEERVRDTGSFFKKFLEGAKKPSIINTESIKHAREAVASEAKAEFKVALSQFGIELTAGHAVSLSKKIEKPTEKAEEKRVITQEHLEYFNEFKNTSESKKSNEGTAVIRQQLDAILIELRNLKNSSDELENVFKDVVVDEVPEKPGIYHLTFYEGFLKLVMKMRDKVQDGVVYAKLFRSRKGEKSYSSMAKKRGTSFTLHHDRTAATQTG